MKRITYISRFAPSLTSQQIHAIALQAARRNRETGITGVLLSSDGLFFQVIEGDDETIDALFARIRRDPRHRDVMCLENSTNLVRRDFADWSMELIDLTESTDLLMRPLRLLTNTLSRTHGILEHYTQPAVRRLIEAGLDPLAVAPQRRERLVFFADVAGFSPISAVLDTTHTIALANTFADVCTGAVSEHGGEVVKLMGDGVMAQFDPRQADAAVRAALEVLGRLGAIRNAAPPDDARHVLYCGVGLDCGEVVEGNVGSAVKMDFTILGDTVNRAAHLESLTRRLPHWLAFSARIRDAIDPQWPLVGLGRHTLKTRRGRVEVFSIDDPLTRKRAIDHDRQGIRQFVARIREGGGDTL